MKNFEVLFYRKIFEYLYNLAFQILEIWSGSRVSDPNPDSNQNPKPNETQIQNLILNILVKKKKKKKKVYGTKNFETSKKIFFLFFLYFKFLNQNFFFLLIYIPKCIELNSESGSRWVLGLDLMSYEVLNCYVIICMRIPS